MKHLNLIGAALTAATALSVLVACDSRGVTAMKSRTFTPEEMAAEKLRRQGLTRPTRTADQTTPSTPAADTASPIAKTDKVEGQDPVVSDKEAGGARNKLFNEGKNGVQALKTDVLLLAKAELGKINKAAGDLLKGLTIVDKSTPGKPRLAIDAILVPDDRALELHAEFNVDSLDQDVINGKSDVKLSDLSASADVDPSRVTVATVCAEVERDVCKKVILIFSAASKDGSKDALVELKIGSPGEVPNEALLTNVGPLRSFKAAQDEAGAKMDAKPAKESTTATVKPVIPRPAVPFAGDFKNKPVSTADYKQFQAKYAEWKKSQTNADQWSKHPRLPTTKPAAAAPAPTPAPETKPAAKVTTPPQMPTVAEVKSMPRSQALARINAYEASIAPVQLPAADKAKLLEASKRDNLPLTEVKTINTPPIEVKTNQFVDAEGVTRVIQTDEEKRAEYEKLPFYSKPFNREFWWPAKRAAELRAAQQKR